MSADMDITPDVDTVLADELQELHPDVDVAIVLARHGRMSSAEVRRELLGMGYDPSEIDLVAPVI